MSLEMQVACGKFIHRFCVIITGNFTKYHCTKTWFNHIFTTQNFALCAELLHSTVVSEIHCVLTMCMLKLSMLVYFRPVIWRNFRTLENYINCHSKEEHQEILYTVKTIVKKNCMLHAEIYYRQSTVKITTANVETQIIITSL